MIGKRHITLSLLLTVLWACESGSHSGRSGSTKRVPDSDATADGADLEVEEKPTAGLQYKSSAGLAIRNFREINYSFASLTGVPAGTPAARATYVDVKANLPATFAADGFSPAGQAGILKLATTYCNQLMSVDQYADHRSLVTGNRDMESSLDSSEADELVEAMTEVMWPTASKDNIAVLEGLAEEFASDGATVKTTATGLCIVILSNTSVLFY